MKKIILVWTIFVISISVNCQNQMSWNNQSIDFDAVKLIISPPLGIMHRIGERFDNSAYVEFTDTIINNINLQNHYIFKEFSKLFGIDYAIQLDTGYIEDKDTNFVLMYNVINSNNNNLKLELICRLDNERRNIDDLQGSICMGIDFDGNFHVGILIDKNQDLGFAYFKDKGINNVVWIQYNTVGVPTKELINKYY